MEGGLQQVKAAFIAGNYHTRQMAMEKAIGPTVLLIRFSD